MSFGYREINLITEDAVDLIKKLMGEEAFIKMRDNIYYELLQNADSKVFMTHSDVFQKVMEELSAFQHKDKYYNLPAEDVFKYFKTFLERADEVAYTLNYTYNDFTLTDEQSITQFYETLLKPLVEKINLGPEGFQIDVEKIKFGRTDSFDDLIEYLTKRENITIGDLATLDEQIVDNIVGLVSGDLQAIELGQMYTAVPGTEGTRPLVNIVTTIYESIDELDNDHLYDLSQWADSFLTLDGVDNVGNVDDWLGAGSSRQAHLKEKIEQYLNDIFDYGQQYKKGEILDTNPILNEDHWYRGKLQRGAGARFGKIFIGEKSDLPWDILLKNSPDPVGFLTSLNPDIAGNALLSEDIYMGISGKTLTSAAGITGNPEIVNGMFDTNFFARRFEDWSIDDIIEKYFMSPIMDNQGYGSPSQFTDEDIFYINEIKKKFTPYNKISMGVLLEGSPGSQEEKLLEIEKSNQLLRQGASELKEVNKVDELKDVYVVTPEQLSEAIARMKDANRDTLFDTHNQLINELKEYLYQDLGFNASAEGAMADLDTVLDDWLTRQGTFEDTKFFNNFPKIENLPDPKNVRGLVAAAGGPENIKTDYVIPQYFKDKPNVTYVDEIDTVEEAITKSDGIDNLNKSKEIINKNPRIFSKILSVLEKFDVGDQVIQQVIKRALPRIGMSAATGPAALAYAAYEVSLLVADAVNATYKAETTSEGFWDNFGEISDKYSIAYKITKPAYDMFFDALKVDLEDDNTLYSFSR